ncbi:MAG: hypothetical protein H6883_08485 [Rhodobiaceae bacterium]|nr:hypothetical protein [Rhodobiaceae bacterium]MCC0056160.1 hypothetical protein [Rhodobiaceae bacterium]
MRSLLALSLFATAMVAEAAAQAAETGISLELNRMEPSSKGCRLTFVAHNGLGRSLTKASYEIALFDRQGLVSRLAVLDFQDLPADKTKVRQFDLSDVNCDDVSRVLVNSAAECNGDGLGPGDCMTSLSLRTRAEIEFGS